MYITRPDSGTPQKPGCLPNEMLRNEEGSALVIALIIMVVLTLLGTVATRTSTTELKIADNNKWHKLTFYEADGATELATELIEQNIEEIGFDDLIMGTDNLIAVTTFDFALNEIEDATTPSDTNRDFFLPSGYVAPEPHTNFTVGGQVDFVPGSSLQMAAAYEGRGKSAAQGGTQIIYDVVTQRVGLQNREAIVRVQWRHVN